MDCLANTGSSVFMPAIIGLGFLGVSIAMVLFTKHNRKTRGGILAVVAVAGLVVFGGPVTYAAGASPSDCVSTANTQTTATGTNTPAAIATTPTAPSTPTPPAPVTPPLFVESFAGTVGAIADTSNTIFDNSPGGPSNNYATPSAATFAANGVSGTAGQIALPAGSGAFAFWGEPLSTPQTTLFSRVYVKVPTLADAPEPIITLKSGGLNGSHLARVVLNSTYSASSFELEGQGDVVVDTGSLSLPADTWVRLDWKVDTVNNTQELRVYVGANMNGTTPDDVVSGTIGSSASPIDYVEFGPTSNPVAPDPFVINYDEIEVRTDKFADPV